MISSFHDFEHLVDPLSAFAKARAWLKPGGLLYLEVPNVNTTGQTFRSRFHFAHVFHYSSETLGAMAGKAGFARERDFSTARAGVVRMLLRSASTATAPVLPPPESIERTRAILAMRNALGENWLRRNIAKYTSRFVEGVRTRGLSGRQIADEAIARRGG
jgi:hypothetical protein